MLTRIPVNGLLQWTTLALLLGASLGHPEAAAQQPPSPSASAAGVVPMAPTSITGTGSTPSISFFYGKRQFFCQIGVTQRWVNILGNVSDQHTISSLTYTLNGGPSVALSMGPDTRRLALEGDFNIDLALSRLRTSGDSNIVIVSATNVQANTTVDTVVVWVYGGTTWPMPTTVSWDWYAGIMDAAQVVDGSWSLNGNSIRTVDIGYDRLVAVGDTTWVDYEVTVPVTIHSIDTDGYNPTSGQPAVGIFMRWSGHTDNPVSGWQPKSGWNPSGALGMYAFNAPGNGGERLEIWQRTADLSGKKIPLGQTHMFKMRVETQSDGHHYALRVWKQTDPEPSDWDLMYLDTDRKAGYGSLLLVAHHVDATFGEVSVGPPTALPVQLVSFSGVADVGPAVRLAWRTLSETGNYGFEVQKALNVPREFTTIPGSFVPGRGTTIDPQDYLFVDTDVTDGIWYYRLRQIDLDGTVTTSDPIQVIVGAPTSVALDLSPEEFFLAQNFPNPFNPVTTIRYTLGSDPAGLGAVSLHVRLAVYDLLGREAAVLVNERQIPGTYQVSFDASGLSSGVYLYRLEAGGIIRTRQMALLK